MAKNVFTLAADVPFLRALAGFVLEKYSADSLNFTRLLILLPNRRSCRTLRECFLDITGGKPILLPRIQPVGEIAEEDIFFAAGQDLDDLPPIDKVRRHFLLTRLVLRFKEQQATGGSIAHAAQLARELASLIDEVRREGISFDMLSNLAPETLAAHWQQTLDFLNIISHEWPLALAEEGAQDVIEYRTNLLNKIAATWKKSPPDYYVIAAGSTGSQPATANLLNTIASMENGMVVLPYLDKAMSKQEWEVISDTHPQYMLKKLLERLELDREEVTLLLPPPLRGELNLDSAREEVVRAVFAPAAATAGWAGLELPVAQGLDGVKLVSAENGLEEAKIIAIELRRVLEVPEKTAALVTPDRTLARMVCAHMQRFGVNIDDSAGKPLNNSAPACFLRLVVEAAANHFSPSSLLALLRHPFSEGGISAVDCRRLSRELEILHLRGIRHGDGLSVLREIAGTEEMHNFLKNFEEKSAHFTSLFAPHRSVSFAELLSAHIEFAQWVAGEEKLWGGEAGNCLAEKVAQWSLQAGLMPAFDPLVYPALFEALLAPEIYYTRFGLHPRLHILSPVEVRLQNFDFVILSGLNEGTWPENPEADPWMSRPQRAAFGLPPKEQGIGQDAYYVSGLMLSIPEVLLTRADKKDGVPTVPSRWWVRLQTLVDGLDNSVLQAMNSESYFAAAKEILDRPVNLPALKPPAPCPPLYARPRSLRVTAIDKWLRDPYSIYAQYILNLKQLDELDREPDLSDFGNIIHSALEIFTKTYPEALPENTMEELLAVGKGAFAKFWDRPAVACLWWARFENMARWLLEQENIRRSDAEKIYSEVKASWEFEVDGQDFSISTRIDRIEKLANGRYAIVDYKTGIVPTKKERERGLANQLPLEALIVSNGNMAADIKAGSVSQMEYWKLSGNADKCEITEVEYDLGEVRARLESLIRQFDNPDQPYIAQTDSSLVRYSDYDHLIRRKEWETL